MAGTGLSEAGGSEESCAPAVEALSVGAAAC